MDAQDPGAAWYYQVPEFRAPVWSARSSNSHPMSTEASQRGSGPLTTDRVTARIRQPAPVDSSADAATQSPAALIRRLSPAEFNTAMIHFYRGEVQRSNTWRNRLDTTTNWAVITAGATLSFVFSSPHNPHFVIPINSILVVIFLLMEARRYRYYEIWSSRVRILETGYFANLLMPENRPAEESWAEHLAADLTTPHFTITEWEAVGRRLRRNYLWIFALLAASWNLKVYLSPLPARDFDAFIERAAVGFIPGWVVFVAANGDELRCDTTGQFISATEAIGTYVIVGGSGRFAHATGHAQFSASLTSGGTFDVTFDGTVDR